MLRLSLYESETAGGVHTTWGCSTIRTAWSQEGRKSRPDQVRGVATQANSFVEICLTSSSVWGIVEVPLLRLEGDHLFQLGRALESLSIDGVGTELGKFICFWWFMLFGCCSLNRSWCFSQQLEVWYPRIHSMLLSLLWAASREHGGSMTSRQELPSSSMLFVELQWFPLFRCSQPGLCFFTILIYLSLHFFQW